MYHSTLLFCLDIQDNNANSLDKFVCLHYNVGQLRLQINICTPLCYDCNLLNGSYGLQLIATITLSQATTPGPAPPPPPPPPPMESCHLRRGAGGAYNQPGHGDLLAPHSFHPPDRKTKTCKCDVRRAVRPTFRPCIYPYIYSFREASRLV